MLFYFRKDIAAITAAVIKGMLSGKLFHNRDAQLGWMIGAGTIPIVVLGLLLKHQIETSFRSLYVISASFILLAVVLMVAEYFTKMKLARGEKLKSLDDLTWKEIVAVGFWQCVALIPGSSRSGTTITGGLFSGMNRETAARFSFLLSLPSVLAAGMLELVKEREALLSSDAGITNLIVATIVSGLVGYASIAFLLNYLKTHTTYLFIVYRIVVGFGLLYMLNSGTLRP